MKNINKLKQDYLVTFNIVVYHYYARESEEFVRIVKDNLYEFYEKVLNDVLDYCKINNIYIQNFDDYKITYFLGIRVYEKTKNISHFISMLKILDILVKNDSGCFVNKDMIQKILLNVKNNKWKENYGKYGIYSMFKACSKHFA